MPIQREDVLQPRLHSIGPRHPIRYVIAVLLLVGQVLIFVVLARIARRHLRVFLEASKGTPSVVAKKASQERE